MLSTLHITFVVYSPDRHHNDLVRPTSLTVAEFDSPSMIRPALSPFYWTACAEPNR